MAEHLFHRQSARMAVVRGVANISLALIFTFLIGYTVARQGALEAAKAAVLLYGSFVVICTLSVMGGSDVVLNENGISRRVLGWDWKKICWSNVQEIRVYRIFLKDSGWARTFHIIPINRAGTGFGLAPAGALNFVERFSSMPELIGLLNQRAAEFGFGVYDRTVDRKSDKRLSAIPPLPGK